jgi:hypothetical protein
MPARSAGAGAARLQAALRAQGGPLAEGLSDAVGGGGELALAGPGPAQLAAAGPRARGNEDEYELLLEMILEGSRLHYGVAHVVRPADSDLALLLGDQLYALGLGRLAALGDLEAVAELADVISLVAQAHTESGPDLAAAVWEAGAVAVGWGTGPAHAEAKSLARRGAPDAAETLRAVALAAQAASS